MLIKSLALAAFAAALFAASGTASATRTLRLSGSQQSFAVEPQGPPTVGSRLIFTNALYNRVPQFGKPAGARVGSVEGVCTVVSELRAQCTVTAHIPDGEIVAMGAMRLTHNGLTRNTFAIVGGAGAYANARGTVESRDVSPTRSIDTLHVIS